MFCDLAESFHWRSLGLGGSGGGFAGSHGNLLIMLIQLAVFHDVFINITCFVILVLCDLAESFDAKDAGVREALEIILQGPWKRVHDVNTIGFIS